MKQPVVALVCVLIGGLTLARLGNSATWESGNDICIGTASNSGPRVCASKVFGGAISKIKNGPLGANLEDVSHTGRYVQLSLYD